MKPKLALVWFLVSLALTALLAVNWRASTAQKLKLETLQLQVEKLDRNEKTLQAEKNELQKENQKLRGELRAAEVAATAAAPAAAAPKSLDTPSVVKTQGKASGDKGPGGNMGAMLETMMKDPEMRKMMEQQQRMGLDMIYGSLFKHLQLPPDKEKALKEAMLEMQMASVSQAGSMFNSTNRSEAMMKMAEERKKSEEKIKEILGEEKFSQYQDYNQTLAERMVLDQFSKQSNMSPEQGEQLLAIMREEKQRMQLENSATDPSQQMKVLESEQAADEMLNKLEQVNQAVMQRAGGVLTPEQMEKFVPFLTNQAAMQRAGMKMARKMMQPDQPEAPAAPAH